MAKYKVDDQFSFGRGRRVVRAVGEIEDRAVYFLEFFNEDGEVTAFESLTEGYIDNNYTKIEPFFEVGKTYRISGGGGTEYHVVQVRQNGNSRFAWAEFEDSYGDPCMISLDLVNFFRMTEV